MCKCNCLPCIELVGSLNPNDCADQSSLREHVSLVSSSRIAASREDPPVTSRKANIRNRILEEMPRHRARDLHEMPRFTIRLRRVHTVYLRAYLESIFFTADSSHKYKNKEKDPGPPSASRPDPSGNSAASRNKRTRKRAEASRPKRSRDGTTYSRTPFNESRRARKDETTDTQKRIKRHASGWIYCRSVDQREGTSTQTFARIIASKTK
ncbi:PREDICTED: uncharacterized protein LOC105562351 isoform X2 [Vollenhovia emeryi]|nr:PREDICTED: uncharacterized protein LOC105562351 isoform X2 [Vollenhovia emeryi]